MRYRVTCSKEKDFLAEGCSLEVVYGGMPFRNLSLEEAEEVAEQLNEFTVDDEHYYVEKETSDGKE